MVVEIGNKYVNKADGGSVIVGCIFGDNIQFSKLDVRGDLFKNKRVLHIDEFDKSFYDPSTPIKEDIKMNLAINGTYQNKHTDRIVKIKEISGGTVTFIFTEVGGPAGEFKELEDGFKNLYVHYADPVDQRKECFACKKPIELGYEEEYKMAYYHLFCLTNGKNHIGDPDHNNLAGIQGDKAENYYELTRDERKALMAKPGPVIVKPGEEQGDADQERLSKLQSEVDYYRKELAKAHELLGRVTHQLSERWDSVRLTQFYPTDNLHGKRTLNNPTGSK